MGCGKTVPCSAAPKVHKQYTIHSCASSAAALQSPVFCMPLLPLPLQARLVSMHALKALPLHACFASTLPPLLHACTWQEFCRCSYMPSLGEHAAAVAVRLLG